MGDAQVFHVTMIVIQDVKPQPAVIILFDGNIPTLTGLDGDMWASQLLALQVNNRFDIISDFSGTSNYMGVDRVEFVMFNCPEWGIAVYEDIGIGRASSISGPRSATGKVRPTITSCDSLVRVCTSHLAITEPVIYLHFFPATGSNRTYIAEVEFYGDGSDCPPDNIITARPPQDTTTLPPPDTTTSPPPDTTTVLDTREEIANASCFTSTVLASVITAIATALLATVISVLVMITVCKCHPKFTPGGPDLAGGEGQEYEEVDGGRGGVAVSDPTYMEIGERRGGNTFQLKENDAYASTIHK